MTSPSSLAGALAALTVLALAAPSATAQEVGFGGQVRPRLEARDPMPGGGADAFTSMRVRAELDARLQSGVRAFVQFQDVRFWGEETSTLGDFRADGFDVHQGWVELGDGEGAFRAARVGRQEVALGGERLIGAVGWTQQGRAFDGVRLTAGRGPLAVDLFAFQVGESAAPARPEDAGVVGAYGVWSLSGDRSLDLYVVGDLEDGDGGTRDVTVGARYAAAPGPWRYRLEGSGQVGTRSGRDVAAYMVGLRAGRSFAGGRAEATLWYDYLSGDETPATGEIGAFRTLYATNHKFYGYADLFLDVPNQTGGHGLQDPAVKLSFEPVDGWSAEADFHAFRLADAGAGIRSRLGEELDLTVIHRYAEGVTFQAGFSQVWGGPGLRDLGRLADDLHFAYVMLSAAF